MEYRVQGSGLGVQIHQVRHFRDSVEKGQSNEALKLLGGVLKP